MWDERKIKRHVEVTKILENIKNDVFDFIGKNLDVTEKKVQNFILLKFKENDLINEIDVPIVAFRENTSIIHYFPKEDCKSIEKDTLILIDIWARFNGSGEPYGDITWMGYSGDNFGGKMKDVFDIVIKARDASLNFVRGEVKKGKMPLGKDLDKVARDIINNAGYEGKFGHGLGHSLGTESPHGEESGLNQKGEDKLLVNIGYTIEPGIYLEGKFGVRSEIDFYVNDCMEVIVTTPVQSEIVMIK